ncbi:MULTISPECIES: hypothetical protein [unclassified Polaromonas]|uniref:hypothetical protein n=1 Tax=unclassified Polaromonas TaxID=2638319 RepID=UPI000F08CE3E|nr:MULTISPECIES: hypothetical protein [unclassified Polaromonas]AYQ27477.1 hypothetical protein DT070_05185 [Polaromonas sp. SP1]QGJ17683.1 hypothetical protein F7R28_04265 [Polaromonas sp. Pch-P]
MDLVSPHLYRDHMIEVKRRFKSIDRILGAKKPRTLTSELDDEFMWLQLRQIVELVAYSAIAADEERYAALRQEQDKNADYRVDSKPAKVLKHLALVNPHFLPKSLGVMVPQADGTKHFEHGSEVALLDRFLEIHDVAGQHLHAINPFNEADVLSQKSRLATARSRIEREAAYLKGVLWDHAKVGLQFQPGSSPRAVENAEQAWIVKFGQAETEGVQMLLAKGI